MYSSEKDSIYKLILGAIGVVYGDIGTSPLYALKSCFFMGGLSASPDVVLGCISVFIWLLFCIVCVKYVLIILNKDWHGEGGVLALSALVRNQIKDKKHKYLLGLGVLGAALFFGDGVLTPAISVLSAVEGITLMDPSISNLIVPITLCILFVLFFLQHFGSGSIGLFFGPIMCIWFCILFLMGVFQIFKNPYILHALNPYYAVHFLSQNLKTSMMVLGGAILVLTGAEALYADMGHFGKRSIRLSWNFFVFPALIFHYLGQGALLLTDPGALKNPFYYMVPDFLITPLVVVSTLATIIASQAILTGLFSITWQAILLGYFPRMKVSNTSETQRGQVYLPFINYLLFVLTSLAVLHFQKSENMALSYGLCVAGIMFITSLLMLFSTFREKSYGIFFIMLIFAAVDSLFLSSSFEKIFEGGGFVLIFSTVIWFMAHCWKKGRDIIYVSRKHQEISLKDFMEPHEKSDDIRIPRAAIFLTQNMNIAPAALVTHFHHNCFLHEKTIVLTFHTQETPCQDPHSRFDLIQVTASSYQIVAKIGYREIPDVGKVLHWLELQNVLVSDHYSIFLGRSIPVATRTKKMNFLEETVFILLYSIAQGASDFYRVPHSKVLELGERFKV